MSYILLSKLTALQQNCKEGLSSPKNMLANTLLGALGDRCEDEFWVAMSAPGDCP